MEQKMHKRILSFIEEERLLSGDERICVDIFRRLKKNRSYLPSSSCRRRVGEKFQLLGRLSLGTQRFSRQRG